MKAINWRWWSLGFLLFISVLLALATGRYVLPVSQVLMALIDSSVVPEVHQRIVWQVRLPRILMAILVGSSLAVCGAALQGAFRNPLVGPQILGISSGAALGGCLAIVFFSSLTLLMGGAFLGGVIAVVIVYILGRVKGQTTMLMLVLAGVVTSAFFSAMISLVTYFADPNDRLPAIVFWLMGSFSTASYTKLGAIALPVLIGSGLLLVLRFRINVLSLGDEQVRAQGIAVEPLRWALLLCVTVVVSASVAVSGTVGWVGLVIPHFARMVVGPDHRLLLPASALIGGIYMVLIDTAARSISSAEIPLGVMTALIGAPVFAWLLRKTQAKGWRND